MSLADLTGSGRKPARMVFATDDTPTADLELAFDALPSEEDVQEWETTSFPIEDGSSISDHRIKRPRRVSFTLVVSAVPAKLLAPLRDDTGDHLTHARKVLDTTLAKGTRFALESRNGRRENLVLTSVRYPRDPDTGDAVVAQCEAVEIVTVEAQAAAMATTPSTDAAPAAKAAPAKPATKAAPEAPAATADKAKTWAAGLTDSLGELFGGP